MIQKHMPTPLNLEPTIGFDGRHHAVPILTKDPIFNLDDGKEPYHPLIARVLMGNGHAPREIAESIAKQMCNSYNSYSEHCKNPAAAAENDLLGQAFDALERAFFHHKNENEPPFWLDEARAILAQRKEQ